MGIRERRGISTTYEGVGDKQWVGRGLQLLPPRWLEGYAQVKRVKRETKFVKNSVRLVGLRLIHHRGITELTIKRYKHRSEKPNSVLFRGIR